MVAAVDITGSPTGGFDGQGRFARREVLVAWLDIDAYSQLLQPASIAIGNQNIIYPGAAFSNGDPNLRVASFTWQPFWGSESRILNPEDCGVEAPEYEYAKFNIEYRYPQSPQSVTAAQNRDPVPFLEHTITSGGQLLNLEQSGSGENNRWQWEYGTDLPDDTPVPVMIGTTQHSVTWPRVPRPNWPNLERFKGTVNNEDFRLRGYTYPAETLLYLNYDMREVVMTNGTVAYTLTLHFEGKLVRMDDDSYGGHNHFWDKDTCEWIKVLKYDATAEATTAIYPYKLNDFNDLFTAEV